MPKMLPPGKVFNKRCDIRIW